MTLAKPIPPEAVQKSFRLLTPVGGGPLIRVDRAALRHLESYIRGGLTRGTGTELCGLVLGRAVDSSSEIAITGFVAIEVKHRSSLEFRPSQAYIAVFKSARGKVGDKAIGYFRSHLSDEPVVRDEDLRLLNELFPAAASCFFVVHAGLNAPSNVDLYRIQSGTQPELLELFALLEAEPSSSAPSPQAEARPLSSRPAVTVSAPNKPAPVDAGLTFAREVSPKPKTVTDHADVAVFKRAAANAVDKTIGYFRSHVSDGPVIRHEDLRLLNELFPASASCFFAVHAGLNTSGDVDRDRTQAGTSPDVPELFALLEAEPSSSAASPQPEVQPRSSKPATAVSAPNKPAPVDAGLTFAADVSPASKPVANNGSSAIVNPLLAHIDERWTWIFSIVTVLILSVGIFFANRHSAPAPVAFSLPPAKTDVPQPLAPKVSLQIQEQDAQVKIFWDPANPAVASATRGMLIITGRPDSPTSEEIELDAAQIHSGFYESEPVKDFLTVQLVIYQSDGSFTGESKTFSASGAHAVAPAPSVVTEPRVDRPPVNTQAHAQSFLGSPALPSDASPAVPDDEVQPQLHRAFLASNLQTVTSPAATSQLKVVSPPAQPDLLPPVPSALSSPVPPSPAPDSTARAIETVPKRLLAPRLIYQAAPAVPRAIASRLRTAVTIDVGVSVDGDGKVAGAQIVSSQGASASLLAVEALKAAQFCRFLPAQQDGKPVPGSLIVTFHFAPEPD
jgi:protein TonB